MYKKSIVLVTALVFALGIFLYFNLRSENVPAQLSDSHKKPQNSQSNNSNSNKDAVDNDTETGESQPKPDVSEKFTLSAGNIGSKDVNVKVGQRVELIFDANFEDEVRLDEYEVKGIYLLPLSEHSTQVVADKPGEFRIYLVKRDKTIGTLIVK